MNIAYAIPAVLIFIGLALTLIYINQRHLRILKRQINNLHIVKNQLDQLNQYSGNSEIYKEIEKVYESSCAIGEYTIRIMTRPCKFKDEILEFRNLKDQLATHFNKPT